jgi:hypothetical protein
VVYAGDEEQLFVHALTVNIARRHLSKGSMAMVAAVARNLHGTESQPSNVAVAASLGIDRKMIDHAAFVAEHLPSFVEPVSAGGSLNDAYTAAKQVQEAHRRTEEDEATREDGSARPRIFW